MMIVNPVSKKKVLLRAPVLTQSGYGVHARQIAKWLMDKPELDVEIQALPWGDTPWLIDGKMDNGFIGKLMEKTVDPNGRVYDASVQLQLPNEWDPRIAKVNIGITAAVEADRCNPAWVNACNSMSMVIVPSKHAASSLTSTGNVKVPLHVVPEAYTRALTQNIKTKMDDVDFSTSFNFLVFGQLTGNNPENDRKNIFYTIKWLCETFKNDTDVGVVVKTNAGRNTDIDRKLITQTFTSLLKEVRSGPFPKVHLVHGDMSDEEVSSLYRHPKIKALVALTRGEGYGLPILEAAASGLPVIATAWSGHTDFLSHGKYIEVDYKLSEVHPSRVDNKIFVHGSKWAHPHEEDFKRKVTKFRSASSLPKEWAEDLKGKILENYSLKRVAEAYDAVTKEIL
jgi:glycosyltransferase involved in cell wall biosynthesis